MQTRIALLLSIAACGSLDTESTVVSELGTQPPMNQLELWLDASRGVGLYPSGEVWWWEDQSGHGHVLGRGSPDSPSIRLAKFPQTDNQLGLRFEPDDSGNRGYLVNSAFALRSPMTIAMVFYPLPTPGDHWDTPLGGARAPTVALTKRIDWLPIPQTVDLAATSGHDSTFRYISARRGWSSSKSIAIATFAGAHSSVDVSNDCITPPHVIDQCQGGRGTLDYDVLDGIVLSHGGDRTFRGFIAEILIYSGELDPHTRADLAQYLNDRYE